jgi:predicted ArsR family transcriptional regulator
MSSILQYLKSHGEKLDTEIAEATGLSIESIRAQLITLAANHEVMVCQSTRFVKG